MKKKPNKKNNGQRNGELASDREARQNELRILVVQNEPALARLLQLCRWSKRRSTRTDTQGLPGVGAIGEQGSILLRVVCGRTATQLRSGCADAEGCVGEPEEGFRREYHSPEASTPTGVEQSTTARPVGGATSKIKDICDSLASIEVNIE